VSTPRRSPTLLSELRLTGPSRTPLVVLAVMALGFAMVPPAGAATTSAAGNPGSIGIRLVDEPVTAGADPRARVYIVDHLEPGTTIKRRIEVSNATRATTQLALYAAAANIVAGSFLGAASHTPDDLTTWTTVTPSRPEVPAGGKVTATVTIAVPKDAAPGEQYGVVWAEARSAPRGRQRCHRGQPSRHPALSQSDPGARPPRTSPSTP
jgi:hypothetical protein